MFSWEKQQFCYSDESNVAWRGVKYIDAEIRLLVLVFLCKILMKFVAWITYERIPVFVHFPSNRNRYWLKSPLFARCYASVLRPQPSVSISAPLANRDYFSVAFVQCGAKEYLKNQNGHFTVKGCIPGLFDDSLPCARGRMVVAYDAGDRI